MIINQLSGLYQPDRNTVILRFGSDDDVRNGEYYVRGGICWPVAVRNSDGGSAVGHSVVVGFNLQSKLYTVFEDNEFVCVDPIVEGGRLTFEGVASWFNTCWARYYCRYWYHHQDETTHRTYLMQVVRSKMIEPKPGFIEIPWTDEKAVAPVFWRLVNTKRLKFTSPAIMDQAGQYQASLGAEMAMFPAVYALTCALVAMERWPWRER
ncbi:MAG: hypothetical protein WC497_05550 [Patescibacteria group bacterium]